MSSANPSVVIVPGSFASPLLYRSSVLHLRSIGFPALAVSLPSTYRRAPLPPATWQDDVDAIRDVLQALCDQGKEIIVLAHSYGGSPMTQAAFGLGTAERAGKGEKGGVKRLIYFAAQVPAKEGEMVAEWEDVKDAWDAVVIKEGYIQTSPVWTATHTFNDAPSWEEAYELACNFTAHSAATFMVNPTELAYTRIPCSYILTELDRMVPPKMQEGYVARLREGGREVRVYKVGTGHAPNLTQPGVWEGVLGRAVGEA